MLLGDAVGGLAGNMTLDRQREERQQKQAMEARRSEQQLQLDFERRRALQAEQTRIEIEEQRLFNEWRRQLRLSWTAPPRSTAPEAPS
jgi:hypothetical protein